ncbi:Aste57867_1969 [Aphanomyces stellatus]|uniref:Aste57867_1969 protein n=1 Tax=Aphanomyces stellatus TaxID=120398 RepID=A0A485K7P5_9STRA|nr:hypothetical protein As57867_001967 [Aphanomyces stellatus]VFT79174.1 Aste57867_1969 [Aphanomyces stellatus]
MTISPHPMSSATTAVLCSAALFSHLVRFQDGIYEDIVPFRHLQGYRKRFKDSEFDAAGLIDVHIPLQPWLALYGYTRLQHLCSSVGRTESMLLYGAYFGDVELLDALATAIPDIYAGHSLPLAEMAIIGGSLRTVHYLRTRQFTFPTESTLYLAAKHGRASIVEHYIPSSLSCYQALRLAATGNHVACVELLIPHCTPYFLSQAMMLAVRHVAIDSVRVLYAGGGRLFSEEPLVDAATQGRLDCLEFFLAQDETKPRPRDMRQASLTGAIQGNHVELASHMLSLADDVFVEPSHVAEAMRHQSVAMVELLWAHRETRWRVDIMPTWVNEYAKWMDAAAQSGRLEMVQCLVPKGDNTSVDWYKILVDATRARQAQIVNWLVESGKVVSDVPTLEQLMVEAMDPSKSHLKTSTMEILSFVKSLLPSTYRLPTSVVEEAAKNEAHVFRFFIDLWWPTHDLETRASVGEACLLAAAAGGKQKNVKLLVSHFHIGVTSAVVDAAKQSCSSKNLIAYLESCQVE